MDPLLYPPDPHLLSVLLRLQGFAAGCQISMGPFLDGRGEIIGQAVVRCISRAWRRSAAAARIGPCPPRVEEALQTEEFQFEIRYLLEKHIGDYDTEPMDVD